MVLQFVGEYGTAFFRKASSKDGAFCFKAVSSQLSAFSNQRQLWERFHSFYIIDKLRTSNTIAKVTSATKKTYAEIIDGGFLNQNLLS